MISKIITTHEQKIPHVSIACNSLYGGYRQHDVNHKNVIHNPYSLQLYVRNSGAIKKYC